MIYAIVPILLVSLTSPAVLGGHLQSQESSSEASSWSYQGPTALPQFLPDGSLADVPEVAAARAAHLAALYAASTDPRAADGDDGLYDVYKYGDNRYPYHVDNSVQLGAAWQEGRSHIPLYNPHPREAEEAWRNKV